MSAEKPTPSSGSDSSSSSNSSPESKSPTRSTRRTLERAALGGVGALAAIVLCFLFSRWLGEAVPAIMAANEAAFQNGPACGAGRAIGVGTFCYGFGWTSFSTGVLIGIVGPLIGTYLVHREMALIGETLAHTAFAGIAFGLLFASATDWSMPLLTAALATAIVGAFGVQWLAERTDTYGDVPIAIVLTGSFAVGTLVISYGDGFSGINIDSYLFGNVAFVTSEGARMMAVLTITVVAVVGLTYKQLLFITFDEQAARVARVNVSAYNTLLIVTTAVVVVGAMQILGVILVAAMLVVPVAAASQVAGSFRETLVLSIVVGEVAVVVGLLWASAYGLAPGGAIVVVAIACYLLAIVASSRSFAALSTH